MRNGTLKDDGQPLPAVAGFQTFGRGRISAFANSQTLVDYGLQPRYNTRVDVAVLASGCDVLFEVKTATPENFLHQLRAAVGQLLEYRFRLRRSADKTVRLVVAIEGSSEGAELEFARQFLASIGLDLVLWREHHRFEGLTPLLRQGPVCAVAGRRSEQHPRYQADLLRRRCRPLLRAVLEP